MNKLSIIVASGGGAAVLSSKDGVMFNDILDTTLCTQSEHGYVSVAMTAFGDTADADALFTGKPLVDGLGHAFLLRNYRAGLGKWLTADPLGYPDGWNQMAYGVNSPVDGFDFMGGAWGNIDFVAYYFLQDQGRPSYVDTDIMELTNQVYNKIESDILPGIHSSIDAAVRSQVALQHESGGIAGFRFNRTYIIDCESICFAMGNGTVRVGLAVGIDFEYCIVGKSLYCQYFWGAAGTITYSDRFSDPADIFNLIEPDYEIIGGRPYNYGHSWKIGSRNFNGGGAIFLRKLE